MGRVEEFVKASGSVWDAVQSAGPERVSRALSHVTRMYTTVKDVFKAYIKYLYKDLSISRPLEARALMSDALLGLHALMYMDPGFLVKTVLGSKATPQEVRLSKYVGIDPSTMEACLEEFLLKLEDAESVGDSGDCAEYWGRGAVLPHVGLALSSYGKPLVGEPRKVVVNALVPWFLNVARGAATGSEGVGTVGVFGASIGRGKTTTVYYTLVTVLRLLGHPAPEEVASRLILLNPEDFLVALEALLERREKSLLVVVDNASVILPKQWARIGGELSRFFVRMNAVMDMLRVSCGAVLFVSNAPGDIASFVRNMTTLDVRGEPRHHTLYDLTVFTWYRPSLSVTDREERLRYRQRVASVYAYPLLKLPPEMYRKDLEAKREISASSLAEAVRSLRTALEERKKRMEARRPREPTAVGSTARRGSQQTSG